MISLRSIIDRLSYPKTVSELRTSRLWLLVPLSVLTFLSLVDISVNQYPIGLGGLYLEFAEEIRQSGWLFPETIPHYQSEGIPYAYPPVAFYLLNIIQLLPGLDGISSVFVLPKIWWAGSITLGYFILVRYVDSHLAAAAGTSFIILSLALDGSYRHGGGVARAGGIMFTILGCYISMRLFQTHRLRWIIAGSFGFGLALMTHPWGGPAYGLLFLTTYIVIDRSIRGLAMGALVAAFGIVIASPWWIGVSLIHGPSILLRTGGDALIGGFVSLQWPLSHAEAVVGSLGVRPAFDHLVPTESHFMFYLGAIGIFRALEQKRILILAWIVVSALTYPQFARFFILLYAGYGLLFICQSIWKRYDMRIPTTVIPQQHRLNRVGALLCVFVLISIAVPSIVVGVNGLDSGPYFITDGHSQSFEWAQQNTEPTATFIVTDKRPAEWFPYVANRTMLISRWGAEWQSDSIHQRNKQAYRLLGQCQSVNCLKSVLQQLNLTPDYIYVPKDRQPQLAADLKNSTSYTARFENNAGVMFTTT